MTELDYLSVGRSADGGPLLRVRILAALAKLFRIQFHIGGWPYGASYRSAINAEAFERANGYQAGQ